MGEALAAGLIDGGWPAATIAVAEVDPDRRRHLEARLPGVRVVPSPSWAAADAEILVVAVKPADAVAALESCAAVLPEGALVLSIAAGVTIESLEVAAPGRPVRAGDAQHRRARRQGRRRDRRPAASRPSWTSTPRNACSAPSASSYAWRKPTSTR